MEEAILKTRVDPNAAAQSEASRLGWLGLAWFEEFGSRTLHKLWTHFRCDGEAAWRVGTRALRALGVRDATASAFAEWRRGIDPAVCARRCAAEGIRFVLPCDAEYPRDLLAVSDPPLGLFCRGGALAHPFAIGVVGTRGATAYGLRATRHVVEPLAAGGAAIISGLALGIDGAAHNAALAAGGATVAVLAGGVNDGGIYPRQHAGLAKRILENNGALASEFPPGTQSLKFHFPLRNRVIAGLSRAILVVEASEKSGSLITAKLALEENRDVFAVPGPITSPVSSGNNALLKSGAIPCTDASDLFAHFEFAHGRDPPPAGVPNDEECAVLAALDRPVHADDLLRALGIPSATLNTLLISLEMKGLAAQEEPDVYSPTAAGRRYRATTKIDKSP